MKHKKALLALNLYVFFLICSPRLQTKLAFQCTYIENEYSKMVAEQVAAKHPKYLRVGMK